MAKELLSDTQIRNAKSGDSPLYDSDDLRFVPSPTTKVISAQLKFKRPEDGVPDILTIAKYRKATTSRFVTGGDPRESRGRAQTARSR